jgi:hypothetical protein
MEIRSDANGDIRSRVEYIVNYKLNTILARKYDNVRDEETGFIYPNILIYEERWEENSKQKTVKYKKTFFAFNDGAPAKQAISEESVEKPYTVYMVLESLTAPIDYSWLYNYSEKAFKASNGKTKKETIFDGSRYEYKAKSKLLSNVLYFGEDKILKNETSYTYSFDQQKNWIEVVQKENNTPSYIVQRDIKYRR